MNRAGVYVALLALRLSLDTWRFLVEPSRYANGEAAYNPTLGWLAAHGGLGSELLALQYKSFCGGCTVHALSSGLTLGLFGDHRAAFAGLALLWTAMTFTLGVLALGRMAGPTGALAFALLFAVPPPGLAEQSLMLWGNHSEGGLFVLAALLGGPAQGVAIGLGLVFSRTTAHALVLLLPALLARRWAVLLGFAASACLLLVPTAASDQGSYDLSLRANLFPHGLAAGGARLLELVDPTRLAPRLYPQATRGAGTAAAVWLAGVGIALAVLLARRRWTLPALLGGFCFLWAATGFPIPRTAPHAALLQSRYHAPFLLLGVAAVAGAVGCVPRRRGIALAALALLPTLWAWSGLPRAPLQPAALSAPVVDITGFATVARSRLSPARIAAATSADPFTEAALRRLEGVVAAEAVRKGALSAAEARAPLKGVAVSSFWQAQTDHQRAWLDLPGLNQAVLADPDPNAAARGVVWNLRHDARPLRAEALRVGLPEGEPCRLCALLGAQAARSCGTDAACLAAALQRQEAESERAAWGAGLAFSGEAPAVEAALPPELAAAFREGAADPLARATEPVLVPREPLSAPARPRP